MPETSPAHWCLNQHTHTLEQLSRMHFIKSSYKYSYGNISFKLSLIYQVQFHHLIDHPTIRVVQHITIPEMLQRVI